MINWQEKFYCRKQGTLEWFEVNTCFGIWGIYTALGAELEMPNGAILYRQSRALASGNSITIKGHEVRIDTNDPARY